MRQIHPHALWIGHVGDVRDWRAVFDAGIQAIVDLASNEAPVVPPRELVYHRIPLVDGAGNAEWLLKLACHTTANLIRLRVPTIVCCSAGLSRSPALAATALSIALGLTLDEAISAVRRAGCCDLQPALWAELCNAFGMPRAKPNREEIC